MKPFIVGVLSLVFSSISFANIASPSASFSCEERMFSPDPSLQVIKTMYCTDNKGPDTSYAELCFAAIKYDGKTSFVVDQFDKRLNFWRTQASSADANGNKITFQNVGMANWTTVVAVDFGNRTVDVVNARPGSAGTLQSYTCE